MRRNISIPHPLRVRSVALALAAAMLASLLIATPSSGATCDVKPVLRGVVVSQGAGGYAPLTLGKDTLVRPQMTLPECASSSDYVLVKGGSLVVSDGITPLHASPIVPTPLVPSGGEKVTECCLAAKDGPADIKFHVDGKILSTALARDAGLAPTFSITVNYDSSTGPGRVETFTTTASFGRQTNALRVLVVRMGDASKTNQWTSDNATTLQNALAATQRMFPVADDVTSLDGAGGLRYHLGGGMLDLGPGTKETPGLNVMGTNGNFCGGSENWDAVRKGLDDYLLAWQSLNDLVVDRVVGVIGDQISTGVTSCYEGQASYPGRVSWVRLVTDTATNRSWSGAVLAQELAHNFGLVAYGDPRYSATHTSSRVADPLDNAYNVAQNRYVSDDVPMVKLMSSTHDNNTFAEVQDWSWIRCSLGAEGVCPQPGGTGASAASGTGIFKIAGSTDGTAEGSDLTSHFTEGGNPTQEPEASDYVLVYRTGTRAQPGELVTDPIGLPTTAEFAHGGELPEHGTSKVRIDAEVPFADGTTLVEVYKGDSPSGTLIYQAESYEIGVGSVVVTPTEWTFTRAFPGSTGAEGDPAWSLDGDLLMYVESGADGCGSLVISDLSAGGAARMPCTTPSPSSPTIAPDNGHVAFVCDGGDVCVAELRHGPDGPSFGAVSKVYSCERQLGACVTGALQPFTGAAADVVFSTAVAASASDQFLVASIGGDLFQLYPFRGDVGVPGVIGVNPAIQLTETADEEIEPTIESGASGNRRIAYSRMVAGRPEIWALDLALPGVTQKQLFCCGYEPSWAGALIAYENADGGTRTGEVFFRHVDNPDHPELITSGTSPALREGFGTNLAVTRPDDGQTKIYVGETTSRRDITVTGYAADPTDPNLAGFVYARSGGVQMPIGVNLPVTRPDPDNQPNIVAFTLNNFEPDLVPTNATATGGLSNGVDFATGESSSGGEIDDRDKPPSVAITHPSTGSVWDQRAAFPTVATAWDAEGRVLPPTEIRLFLSGPGFTDTPLGDASRSFVSPAEMGLVAWPIGTYTLRAVAADGESTGSTSTTFSVPTATVDLDFEPNTLYVPSSGNPVTVYVDLPLHDIRTVSARSVKITSVGDLPFDLPVSQWTVEGNVGIAKFDRQKLTTFMHDNALVGFYVPVRVEGAGRGFSFAGIDPAAPVTSRSS